MIIMGMAAIPQRFRNFDETIPILADQCDKLYIHISGTDNYPKILDNYSNIEYTINTELMGSQYKYKMSTKYSNSYFLTCDDDLLYPEDYVSTMIESLKQHENKAIVCVYANKWNPHNTNKPTIHQIYGAYHLNQSIGIDTRILWPGMGTGIHHTSSFSFSPEECRHSGMADIYVMVKAAKLGIPIYTIKRKHNWIKQLDEGGFATWANQPHKKIDEYVDENRLYLKKTFNEILLIEMSA